MKPPPERNGKPRVYLAGPDVFLPGANMMAQEKKRLLERFGMEGLFPLDNEIEKPASADPGAIAAQIARLNFAMMDGADAGLAHLTPFRGPSADAGTIGEVFYMFARGKPVFGYSNDARPYNVRVIPDGMAIEDFGLFDNLMIPPVLAAFHAHAAAPERYYEDLTAFEQAVRAAARHFGLVV